MLSSCLWQDVAPVKRVVYDYAEATDEYLPTWIDAGSNPGDRRQRTVILYVCSGNALKRSFRSKGEYESEFLVSNCEWGRYLYPTTEELFESFSRHRPESKLELIEGRLIVGNTIVGSRLLPQQILQGWKAEAAIALAPLVWAKRLARCFEQIPWCQVWFCFSTTSC